MVVLCSVIQIDSMLLYKYLLFVISPGVKNSGLYFNFNKNNVNCQILQRTALIYQYNNMRIHHFLTNTFTIILSCNYQTTAYYYRKYQAIYFPKHLLLSSLCNLALVTILGTEYTTPTLYSTSCIFRLKWRSVTISTEIA